MRSLIEFLQRYFHWIVFIALEVVSLRVFFLYNSYQGSVYFSTANRVAGSLYALVGAVKAYWGYGAENKALEAENERLRAQLHATQDRLQRVLAAADTVYCLQRDTVVSVQLNDSERIERIEQLSTPYTVQPAQVIGLTLHRANNLMTIDRGTSDGVQAEMGVVSSTGVVGIVYMASRHYAVVMPLLNTNAHISCRLRGAGYFGTMVWLHGDATRCYVRGIPRHAQVKAGDVVETNGYSDIFPAGVPVGTVETVRDASDGMTYELTVLLATDFTTLRNVSVLTDYTSSERRELERQVDAGEEGLR